MCAMGVSVGGAAGCGVLRLSSGSRTSSRNGKESRPGGGLLGAPVRARPPPSLAPVGGRRVGWPLRAVANEAFGEKDMCRNQVNERREVDPSSSSADRVKVTFLGAQGAEQSIECPSDTYILDAAVEEGIDLPWSCKGGICGCCVGRVASGAVDMSDVDDISFVLEEEDVAKGMSLLCMARPVAGQDIVIETQCDWGMLMGIEEWKGPSGNVNNVVGNAWKAQATHKPLEN